MRLKIGEVRNFKDDPTKSGRVRVRIYNQQNDEQQVKDDDLPWAMVMHPITSAATSKTGIIPNGLRVGSRVIVAYLPDDSSELYPIVIGSIARGDLPSDENYDIDRKDKDSGSKEHKNKGIDNPGHSEAT